MRINIVFLFFPFLFLFLSKIVLELTITPGAYLAFFLPLWKFVTATRFFKKKVICKDQKKIFALMREHIHIKKYTFHLNICSTAYAEFWMLVKSQKQTSYKQHQSPSHLNNNCVPSMKLIQVGKTMSLSLHPSFV